jgi:flagellar biogenesis protein FliO
MIFISSSLFGPEAVNASSGSTWADYFKIMLILAGLLLSAVLTLRFWMPRLTAFRGSFSSGPLRVSARLPLDSNRSLYVVAAGKSHLLIGSSEAGLQIIAKLDASDVEELPVAPRTHSPAAFERFLKTKAQEDRSV